MHAPSPHDTPRSRAPQAAPARHRAGALRRPLVWLGVCGVVVLAGCRDRVRIAPDDQAQLTRGEQVMDSILARSRAADALPASVRPVISDADAIALGYLERLRLGLGAPFRLVERAMSEPRLPPELRRPLAWALLARTARGQTFALDPAALSTPPDPHLRALVDGRMHQATIDSVVDAARDARTGEQTVRLAYALARAERLVPRSIADAAVHAAALARDRRLAREDAVRLLTAAAREKEPSVDALALTVRWRASYRFRVERPLLADDMSPMEADAAAAALSLLGHWQLDVATLEGAPATAMSDSGASGALTLEAAESAAAPPLTTTSCGTPDALLPCVAARRLASLPSTLEARPQAPVVVTLGGFRTDTSESLRLTANSGPSTLARRFLARAHTPEALVARWTLTRHQFDGTDQARLATLVHATAVALRPFAQAPVRLATRRDSVALSAVPLRTGVRALTFDRAVPATWRNDVARELLDAVTDLTRVFPALTLDGAAVRIGATAKRDSALALHEPRTRTIFLPPATAAGTLAHEIVHDLDWQTARTRFAIVGSYGTDRAARAGHGPLADAVRGLAAARPTTTRPLGAPRPGASSTTRPAELFARSADWFAAAALARQGRMNGTLTVAQDAELTGYAGARPAEPGDGTAEAFLDALAGVTPVAPATRAWYLARFGHGAPPSALTIARVALDVSPMWTDERILRDLGVPAGLADAPTTTILGRSTAACAIAPWHHRLLWTAADARARGILRAQAARVGSYGMWNWQARAITGAPWRPESAEAALTRTRDAILRAALRDLRMRAPLVSPGCAF